MFLGLLPALYLTWTIAASTIAAMFVRPRRIPEAIWACLGAGLLIAFHLVPFPEALCAVTKGYDVYLFLTRMVVCVPKLIVVVSTQVILGAASTIIPPALAALSLGIVGRKLFLNFSKNET